MSKGLIAVWSPVAALLAVVVLWSCESPDTPVGPAPAKGTVKEGTQQPPTEARAAPPKELAEPEMLPSAIVPATETNPAGGDTTTAYGSDDTSPTQPDATNDSMTQYGATDATTDTTYGTDTGRDGSTDYGTDTGRDTSTTYGTDYGTDTGRDTTTDYGTDYGTDTGRDTSTNYGTDYGTDTGRDTTSTYGTNYGTTTYGTSDTTTTKRELVREFSLFDGFEEARVWASESASDHADITRSDEQVTEGEGALKAAFKALGKGNFELRREVGLDLTDAEMLKVDVYNACEGPLELKMAFRAGYDTTLFTSPPKVLEAGWNRDLAFPVKDFASEGTSAYGDSWDWSRYNVTRVSLIFNELNEKEGTVHVDNLRFDRPATELGLRIAPKLVKIESSARVVERFDPLVLTVDFEADYQDHFDRLQVDVLASFFSPSGAKHEVHGFVYDTDAATGDPVWKVRFTPTETGQWRYDVTVTTDGGTVTSKTYAVNCQHKADRRGFIRRAASDPRYFEYDDDSCALYYPIGQNVCWASDYDHYLAKMEAYGGNYVRVWLCPWNLQLEEPKEAGKYDLRAALALDALLDQCRRRGIAVQLVLRYHGMQGADWAKNPYNSANGGPCMYAGDFFTNSQAKTLHKQFLDYVVARWGHSPAIFAWELWNEADLAKPDREADLLDWHREMSDYLKKIDVNKHLVCTSTSNAEKHMDLFKLPNIDFVPVHFYAADVWKRVYDNWVRFRDLRKPVFIGEFSSGFKPGDDLRDVTGVHLHAGLWLALTTPMAGNAMPWWWDTFVDKNDLYPHWAALVKFAKGIERRGSNADVLRSKVKVGENLQASVQALVSPSSAILWVYDEGRIRRPEQATRPLLPADRQITLRGMLGGRYQVEVWDTYEGTVLAKTSAESEDGALAVTLPKCDRDVAVKIAHEGGDVRPALEWE